MSSAYRDRFETCPRCGVDLVEARSARACPDCRGLWVEEAVVSEMVLEMLPPQPLSRLELAIVERTGDPIACPTCQRPMQAASIHGVKLDRCADHGVWFDADELQTALLRVADPSRPPPLVPLAPARRPKRSTPIAFTFVIQTPDRPVEEVRIQTDIVKIGRMRSANLQLSDPRVNRMHAIIDATTPSSVWLIDLGSDGGTLLRGNKVAKAQLHSGDQLVVGATTIDVTFR